jgi:pimeloyl-ACP methyl ester carboxylesterase
VRALSLFAAIVLLGAATRASFDPNPYLHAQRLVDIGGRRINLYCTGSGSPTAVLDAGANDTTLAWRFVQPAVARHTRVCSYDRAGLGFSDPASSPRDASAAVRDLHALLARAGIAAPYVLVAHSLAGLYAPLYADRYSREVVGMVLVDPGVAYQRKRIAQAAPALAQLLSGVVPWDRACSAAADRGEMHSGTSAYTECMWPSDPALPSALNALLARQWQRPGTWRALTSADGAADSTSSEQVVREQRNYGSMPLIVLSEQKFIDEFGALPPTQRRALLEASMQWHDRIAALSSRGENVLVKGSGHDIPIDRPSSVISAIDTVVDRARASH